MRAKHSAIFVFVGLSTVSLLSSCWSENGESAVRNSVPASERSEVRKAAMGDSVAIDYVLKLDGGSVFDTTISEGAEKSSKYDPKRTYSPILVRLGTGQIPKGLENAVAWMSAGEKKTVTVSPGEGYGTAFVEVTMAKRLLEDSYEETYAESKYRDSFEAVVTDTEFAAQGKSLPKVGDVLSSGGVTSRVMKIEGGLITLSVENRKNPFYGKKLSVWLVGSDEGNRVTVTKIENGNVTVMVENASNPFKWKKVELGASTLIGGELHTVLKIDGDTVVLKKGHELAGKTLTYEVTLREIKP